MSMTVTVCPPTVVPPSGVTAPSAPGEGSVTGCSPAGASPAGASPAGASPTASGATTNGRNGSRPEKNVNRGGLPVGEGEGVTVGGGAMVGGAASSGGSSPPLVRKKKPAAAAASTPRMVRARRSRGESAIWLPSWTHCRGWAHRWAGPRRGSRPRRRSRARGRSRRSRACCGVGRVELRSERHLKLRRSVRPFCGRDRDDLCGPPEVFQPEQKLVHREEPPDDLNASGDHGGPPTRIGLGVAGRDGEEVHARCVGRILEQVDEPRQVGYRRDLLSGPGKLAL